jgi:hypothetical protein
MLAQSSPGHPIRLRAGGSIISHTQRSILLWSHQYFDNSFGKTVRSFRFDSTLFPLVVFLRLMWCVGWELVGSCMKNPYHKRTRYFEGAAPHLIPGGA